MFVEATLQVLGFADVDVDAIQFKPVERVVMTYDVYAR